MGYSYYLDWDDLDEQRLDWAVANEAVEVHTGQAALSGCLTVPGGATGIVVLALAASTSRDSAGANILAEAWQSIGLASLVIDLVVDGENAEVAEDAELLAARLLGVTHWLRQYPSSATLKIAYAGHGVVAAAAWLAAAAQPEDVAAIVAMDGRPEQAWPALDAVQAPVMQIVAEVNEALIEANQRARSRLQAPQPLAIIAGVHDLQLDQARLPDVARLSGNWLSHHL